MGNLCVSNGSVALLTHIYDTNICATRHVLFRRKKCVPNDSHQTTSCPTSLWTSESSTRSDLLSLLSLIYTQSTSFIDWSAKNHRSGKVVQSMSMPTTDGVANMYAAAEPRDISDQRILSIQSHVVSGCKPYGCTLALLNP